MYVARSDGLARTIAGITRLVPQWLTKAWQGPVSTVTLGDSKVDMQVHRGRPCRLIIEPDLTLLGGLDLPHIKASAVEQATTFHLETFTPFQEGELLGFVVVPPKASGSRRHRFAVTSKELVLDTLRSLHVSTRAVSQLHFRDTDGRLSPNLAAQLDSRPLATAMARLAPWLILALAGLTSLASDLVREDHLSAQLEQRIETRSSQLRELNAELETRRAVSAGATDLRLPRQSVFDLINSLRGAVPTGTRVRSLKYQPGELRLAAEGDDLLKSVREISRRLPAWTSSMEGEVRAGDRGESATVLFRSAN